MLTRHFAISTISIVLTIITFGGCNDSFRLPADEVCNTCNCITNIYGENQEITIDCTAKGLTGIPINWPDGLANDTDMKGAHLVASFSGNSLHVLHKIPTTEAASVTLAFRHCNLREIEQGALEGVSSILSLDLSWNQLTGETLRGNVFQGRYSDRHNKPLALQRLELHHNQIHTMERKIFEHMDHLKELYLGYNSLSVLDEHTLVAINSAKQIEILDLSYNDIKDFPDDLFHELHLRELNLEGNEISQIPESISLLENTLEVLNLGNNPITELNDNSFLDLHKLTHLNISASVHLKRIKSMTFAPLKSLQVLVANNCSQLTSISEKAFSGAENSNETWSVHKLILSNNKLKTLPKQMITWPKLELLNLDGNPWHCNCRLISIVKQHKEALRETDARCATPNNLRGTLLTNVQLEVCNEDDLADNENEDGEPIAKETRLATPSEGHYSRPGALMLIGICVAVVLTLGLLTGLLVVVLKRRLKKNNSSMFSPVRYTTVGHV